MCSSRVKNAAITIIDVSDVFIINSLAVFIDKNIINSQNALISIVFIILIIVV